MKIVLYGYGKMGKEIERLALERGVTVLGHVDTKTGLDKDLLAEADVVLHFATAATVLRAVNQVTDARKNIVIGTTGWTNEFSTVKALVQRAGVGMVYSPNFSLGVALFNEVTRQAGRLLNSHRDYDVAILEAHHKEKEDAPSGTALTLAKNLMEVFKRKKAVVEGSPKGKIKPEQLQIASLRTGSVVGMHSVVFDSAADTITMTHEAKNRSGFAYGAILAVEWIKGKQGVFTFQEVVAEIIKPKE
jgi:4-hydroxy-tetrahydrodipicolinate reductase